MEILRHSSAQPVSVSSRPVDISPRTQLVPSELSMANRKGTGPGRTGGAGGVVLGSLALLDEGVLGGAGEAALESGACGTARGGGEESGAHGGLFVVDAMRWRRRRRGESSSSFGFGDQVIRGMELGAE